MRYSPNRSYFHPVLRPHSDDYPNTSCDEQDIQLTWELSDAQNGFSICIQFNISEPTIREAVESGDAECIALLHCRSTMHRQALTRSQGTPFQAEGVVAKTLLAGEVEISPLVMAKQDMTLKTHTAHEDYAQKEIALRKGTPLATYYPWLCDAPDELRPVESVMQFDTDENLEDGIFRIDTDVANHYIRIQANQRTRSAWKNKLMRRERFSTIYLAAITQALTLIANEDLTESGQSNWVDCFKKQLAALRISLLNSDGEHEPHSSDFKPMTPGQAAQHMLNNPLKPMLFEEQQDEEEL